MPVASSELESANGLKGSMPGATVTHSQSSREATWSQSKIPLPKASDSELQSTEPHETRPHSSRGTLRERVNCSNPWMRSEREEKALIKQFWHCLTEFERKGLVELEKRYIVSRIREQQRTLCLCDNCIRMIQNVEQELSLLYDAYYEELELLVYSKNRDTSSSLRRVSNIRLPSLFGAFSDHSKSSRVVKVGKKHPEQSQILHIANELLSNDGRELLECLDENRKVASPRLSVLAKSVFQLIANPEISESPPMAADVQDGDLEQATDCSSEINSCCSHCCSESEESQPLDDSEDLIDADMESECCCHDCQAHRKDREKLLLQRQKQRLQDGRRVFQLFAARMFEQRVLIAYREKIAEERQQQLLAEEELEKKQQLVCETTKKLKQGRKRQQKLLAKQQRAEEQRKQALQRLKDEQRKDQERREQERTLAAKREAEQRERDEKRLQELAKDNRRKDMERKRREKERAELEEKRQLQKEAKMRLKQERLAQESQQRALKAKRREEHQQRLAERERQRTRQAILKAQSQDFEPGAEVGHCPSEITSAPDPFLASQRLYSFENEATSAAAFTAIDNLVEQTRQLSVGGSAFYTPLKSQAVQEASDIPSVAESVVNCLFNDSDETQEIMGIHEAFKSNCKLVQTSPSVKPLRNTAFDPLYLSPLPSQLSQPLFNSQPPINPHFQHSYTPVNSLNHHANTKSLPLIFETPKSAKVSSSIW